MPQSNVAVACSVCSAACVRTEWVAGGGGAALLFGAVLSVATELGSADTHYAAQHNRLKD